MAHKEIDSSPEDRKPTVPPHLQMSLRAFETEEAARKFGDLLVGYVSLFSTYLDLGRLDGITVAYDYVEALAQLDRGYDAPIQLTPTTELAQGIAMTPPVIRNGVVRAHMVFNGQFVRILEDEQHELWKTISYTVAHECGHVHDLKYRDIAFPGIILNQKFKFVEEGILWQIADCCWGEYAACRLSAIFYPDQTALFEETFITALEAVRGRANALIRAYRLNRDLGRIFTEVTQEYGALMKFASYVIGHLSGVGADISAAPRAKMLLEGHWFEPFFRRMGDAFDGLWERYGRWTDVTEFSILGEIGRDLIAAGGVHVSRAASGDLRISVPLTVETM